MEIRFIKSLVEIEQATWDKVVPGDFPFASHCFLKNLELARCVGPGTAWTPLYVTAWQSDELQGALVLYVKTDSYGEYIFDFAWANAYAQSGLPYYPKLVASIPFTPAVGPKILLNPDLNIDFEVGLTEHSRPASRKEVAVGLLTAARGLLNSLELNSLHALFITEEERATFAEAGFLIRQSFQFHWENEDYQNFNGFLRAMRSKRRRDIQRERDNVHKSGLLIRQFTGDQLNPSHASIMFEFYLSTVDKMGGQDYLNEDFFVRLFHGLANRILFVMAETPDGHPVAGALNIIGETTLFGRYWGSAKDYRFLHFEVCYYQAIEFALAQGLKHFQAGAQGEHKFQRGFLPTLTYSAHWIPQPGFHKAIGRFINEEKMHLELLFKDYEAHTPFQRIECGVPSAHSSIPGSVPPSGS